MNLETIQNGRLKSILQFGVPSIIAMVLTSLITVADGFFIGNYVGKEGLAAVNWGLPIVYLYLAVGLMVSVGGIAIAGMALGAGDLKKCNSVFNQTISTSAIFTVLLSIIMWLCFDPMLKFLNADVQVAGFFKDYYGIMLLQLPIMVINASFGRFIRGEGKPQYFMQVNILNVLLNIMLDYLFVSWFDLGVKGVAFSSVFAYNYVILRSIGVDGVTAFTIVGYICYVFNMVLIGFGQGVSILISFAYGAKENALARSLRKITNGLVFIAGAVVFLLVLVGSGWYSRMFVKSDAIEHMVRSGAIIYAISFLFSGVNTISSFYFTSIGKAAESVIISLARGLVLLLACIFILPPLLGMTGVWLVAPITEGLTLLLSFAFIVKDNRTLM